MTLGWVEIYIPRPWANNWKALTLSMTWVSKKKNKIKKK
jgi:hypothetical protein